MMKYLNNKIINIAILASCCLALLSCKEEEQVFEYKAIPKTETGAKLVGTNLLADIFTDSSYVVTPGVMATEIVYLSMTGKAIKLFVFEVDLTNPDISIEVSTPNNLPAFGMQQMTKQATFEDSNGHKVWAGVNADFYNTSNGTPESILYKDGVAIKTSFTSSRAERITYFSITKDKKALIGDKTVYDSQKADFKEAVGGGAWLVRDGIVVGQTDETIEPRTWAGISEDGLKVWFMAVDGRNFWYSNGMKYIELAQCMKAVGAYNSINLDGGGSTTFFIRNTPDFTENRFEIRNWPCDNGGMERAVANGLLIIGK